MHKIAVVSPTAPSRQFIAAALKSKGYQVCCSSSWRELGRSAIKIENQALFVVDHSLGDERVIQIIRAIRQEQTEYRIPIMVVSASSRSEDVLRLYKQGIDDYYLKPLDAEVFCDRIRRLLSLFPTSREPQYPGSIELDLNRLINFEIARARRGNYPFAIIQLSLDTDELKHKPDSNPQELMNTCYESLRKQFRETDILIGTEDRLVVLCPFSDRMGTQVVMRKIIEHLNQHEAEHPFNILEMSYAIYPYDGRDQGGLWTFASANKESLGVSKKRGY